MTQVKKLKHSKFKNTGILFELLVKQVTSDILSGQEHSKATDILKKFFKEGTELFKELKIYKFICEEKTRTDFQSEKILETCIQAKKKINESLLNKEKFELIKEIKNNWDIEQFLKGSLNNYRLIASVYKVLEESVRQYDVDPREIYQAKNFIFEHLISAKKSSNGDSPDDLINIYKEQSEDLRLLSYKLLVDKFNKKYSILSEEQKKLIKEYIYNVSNTNSLRNYINDEVPKVKQKLNSLLEKVEDKVLKIKINEAVSQLDKICESSIVKDHQVSSMLIAYELIKELSTYAK